MGKKGRGRGHSSSTRGRGQNGPLHRTRKSCSPDPRRPTIVVTGPDSSRLHPTYVAGRSPIRTRQSSRNTGKQQQHQQQQSGGGGPSTSKPGSSATLTTNQFEMLSSSSDDEESDGENNTSSGTKSISTGSCKTLTKSNKRMPPITILDCPAAAISNVLSIAECEFEMKVLKSFVRVNTLNQTMFDKVLSTLKAKNFQFYTHDTAESVPIKIVLTGFCAVPIPELMDILAEYEIKPRQAKVLSSTRTVTGEHVLYLLYFERGSVKMQDLRRIRSLDGYVVQWRFFTKRPADASQCHRCQRFGHGSRNCTLTPKCVKCGSAHLTDECSLPKKASLEEKNNAERHKPNVKCANCQGNHTANYRGCTARKSYLEALEKQKKKPVTHHPPRTSLQQSSDERASHPPGWGRSYASVAASGSTSSPNETSGGGLFTLTEFLSLAREMFTRLSTCRNKQEQFFALQELTGKYLYVVQV